jgi:hypothetical protein
MGSSPYPKGAGHKPAPFLLPLLLVNFALDVNQAACVSVFAPAWLEKGADLKLRRALWVPLVCPQGSHFVQFQGR